jgi:hypothetical protein
MEYLEIQFSLQELADLISVIRGFTAMVEMPGSEKFCPDADDRAEVLHRYGQLLARITEFLPSSNAVQ